MQWITCSDSNFWKLVCIPVFLAVNFLLNHGFRLPYIDRIDQKRIKMNLILIFTIVEKSTSWRRYENSRLKAFKKYHETKTAIKTRRCMKNLPSCRIYSGKSFRACSKRELYFFYVRFLLQQCEVYRKYYWYWHFLMSAVQRSPF